MARKISWMEPDETTVTSVEISRSSSIYGTYSVLDTINATDDGGAKSSSNSWVTTYTDASGTKTHWYKIRFYDGTYYSDYSDATASEELLRLCTVADVKVIIETTGRFSDDEIFDTITETDDNIYIECGMPLQSIWSEIGTINTTAQTRYYVGEENIYRVDRVFYGTTTKNELFLDDQYRTNNKYGMIEVLPYASSGYTLDTTCDIEVQYVPSIYHKISLYRTCKALLEKIDMTSGGDISKELTVIEKKLDAVEKILINKVGLQLSSQVVSYDATYGVNKKHILQDHDRNRFIGSVGW